MGLLGRKQDEDNTTLVSRTTSIPQIDANEKTLRTPSELEKLTKEKNELVDYEDAKEIKSKTLTWKTTCALLCTEYIVIAILSFPSSYSVLGMAGGVIATLGVAAVTLYTSHILWRYCMRHPDIVDVMDLSMRLFGKKWVYELTGVAFLLNNMFIMGLHTLAGSIALNTISDHATCTIVFTVVLTIAMFLPSLVRELHQVAVMGIFAAVTMLLALLLTLIFSGTEAHPQGEMMNELPTIRAFAAPGTTFVHGLQACLNIVYTFVGQILIPSYIQEMKDPENFPKALYVCTAFEVVLFTLGGSILYWKFGEEYVTSPAYGSLERVYAKAIAGFTLPTIVVVGILYSNITARYIFFRIYDADSVHRRKHTKKGWAVWIAVVAVVWIVSWIIGEAIPFFNDLLALMSSLFDFAFGFVFWAIAYLQLYRGRLWKNWVRKIETIINYIILFAGIFVFGAGTVTSAFAIKESYSNGTVSSPFSCANNGF